MHALCLACSDNMDTLIASDVPALLAYAESSLRVYVYPITTMGWRDDRIMLPFVKDALRNVSAAPRDDARSRETYSAGLQMLQRLLSSRMRTTDTRLANLFVVPQWEGLLGDFGRGMTAFRGFMPQLDLVLSSQTYAASGPARNHVRCRVGTMASGLRCRHSLPHYSAINNVELIRSRLTLAGGLLHIRFHDHL